MKPLEFDQSLVTGFEDIDEHHRRLFEAANRVLFPTADNAIDMVEALVFLRDYTRYHFAAEEFVMDQLDYPGADAHRKWHERLTTEVEQIEAAVRTQGATRGNQARLHLAMDDWLRMHILGADSKLVEFIKQERSAHNVLLPTLELLVESGFDATHTMEMSIIHTEGQLTQAEIRARRNARKER